MSNIVLKRGVVVKKTLFFIIIVVVILAGIISANAQNLYYNNEYHYYDAGVIGLKINGKSVDNLPMSPVIISDYTMVPVREMFEALGAEVIWHDDTCRVEIKDNGKSVFIKIGDRNAYVGTSLAVIEEPQPLPMLIGYDPSLLKSMVPVRFVAEKLGYTVNWDNDTRTVLISDKDESGDIVIGTVTPGETAPVKPPVDTGAVVVPDKDGIFGTVAVDSDSKYDYVYISARKGVSPKITRYKNPDRIVFDFPSSQFSTAGGTLELNGNSVDSVRYSNYNSQARVVLDISDSTQALVMSYEHGIMIRTENSSNDEIIYDAFSKRVYFNKAYAGIGKSIENGYKVTFTNLKLSNQKIEVHDSNIYEIIVEETENGCSVSVDGSNKLSYTAEKGFYKNDGTNPKPSAPQTSINREKAIMIDAGHGGTDPGAVGYSSKGEAVAYESHINLAIALLVGEKLEKSGYDVIYTRQKDEYIALKERADIANENECALFVSIHCNSIDKADVNGTQVYYHPVSETGTVLAENIYDEIVKRTGLSPKKTQNGSHLYVIRCTVSPAVLVETAFISNQSDRQYLMSKQGQEALAESIYQGIIKTLK